MTRRRPPQTDDTDEILELLSSDSDDADLLFTRNDDAALELDFDAAWGPEPHEREESSKPRIRIPTPTSGTETAAKTKPVQQPPPSKRQPYRGQHKAATVPPQPAMTRTSGFTSAQGIPPQLTERSSQIDYLAKKLSKTRDQLRKLYEFAHMERTYGHTINNSLREQMSVLDRRISNLEIHLRTITAQAEDRAFAQVPPTQVIDAPKSRSLDANPLMVPRPEAFDPNKINQIDRFLRLMVERGASDLHLTVGRAPMFRDSGDIEPLRYRRLSADDWCQLVKPITPRRIWTTYEADGDADFAYEIPEVGRFRVNLFRQLRGGGAVFRAIPQKIMTVEQLGLPEQIHRIAKITGGLVLVTGPTGSGKSTTLAAIINEINENCSYHILTLEDPIEFVHEDKRSLLHQREVGTHSSAFSKGLSDAVREDPNLLLVGEMRDAETIRLALESAEKGLLVFGTVHTNNCTKTVDRLINSFGVAEQETIRTILADTIRAIMAQQLVKKIDGGRVAAIEILFGSPALTNLIRGGKSHQITSLIQTGRSQGMIAMDDSLKQLVDNEVITLESAYEKAIEKKRFIAKSQAELEEKALQSAKASTGTPKASDSPSDG